MKNAHKKQRNTRLYYEAMMRRSEPDKDNDTVLEVYQAGYMIGKQVLRPSKVIVNKIDGKKH